MFSTTSKKSLDEKRKIQIHDFCVKKGKAWFTIDKYNKLFCYDFEMKRLNFVKRFVKEKINRANLFLSMEEHESKLLFIPFMAENIYIYDIIKNELEILELDFEKDIACKYCSCYEYDKCLYLLPVCCKNILKIDMNNYRKEYEWNEEISNFIEKEGNIAFFGDTVYRYKDNFISYFSESKKIVIFDMIKHKFAIKELEMNNNIVSICGNRSNIFCLERKTGNIISWCMETQKVNYMEVDYSAVSFDNFNEIANIRLGGIVHGIFRGDNIYLCPDVGNCYIKIDLSMKKAYTIIERNNRISLKQDGNLNSKIRLVGNNLIFFFGIESSFFVINEKDSFEKYEVLLEEKELSIMKEEILKEEIMEEDCRMCNLQMFVDENINKRQIKKEKMIGYEIIRLIEGECRSRV